MLEFFEALFGGAYIAGKYASDKRQLKSANVREQQVVADHQAQIKEWQNKVVDRKLEYELEDFIFQKGHYDEIWAEVSEAFSEMPWNAHRKSICVSERFPHETDMTEALRIMMARRGKLRYTDAMYGIDPGKILAPTKLERRRCVSNWKNFVKWIDRQLQAHGIHEQLVTEVFPDCVYTIDSCDWRDGIYKWAPVIRMGTEIRTE